jgi:hypothetical protein
MKRRFLVAAILAASPVGAEAAPPIFVTVSSYADSASAVPASYKLVPDDSTPPDSLEFREYAAQIDRMLQARGWTKAADTAAAQVAILVSYGIGEPKEHHYSYSLPIYGQDSWVPIHGQYTTYHRWLKLRAMQLNGADNQKATESWRIDATSDGSRSDLRQVFTYLLFAASPYVGQNSGKAIDVKIKWEGKPILGFQADAKTDHH